MRKPHISGIIIGLILALGLAGLWFFRGSGQSSLNFLTRLRQSEAPAPEAALSSDLSERFTHPARGFSLNHPPGFKVSSFREEGGGETLLFEASPAPDRSGNQRPIGGFQIFISPFDEAGPLTAERVKRDLPQMAVDSPESAKIGGAEAVVFFQPRRRGRPHARSVVRLARRPLSQRELSLPGNRARRI